MTSAKGVVFADAKAGPTAFRAAWLAVFLAVLLSSVSLGAALAFSGTLTNSPVEFLEGQSGGPSSGSRVAGQVAPDPEVLADDGTIVLANGSREPGVYLAPSSPEQEGGAGTTPQPFFDPVAGEVGIVSADNGWLALVNMADPASVQWVNLSWQTSWVWAGVFDPLTNLSYLAVDDWGGPDYLGPSYEYLYAVNDSTGSIVVQDGLGGEVSTLGFDPANGFLFTSGVANPGPDCESSTGLLNVTSDKYVSGVGIPAGSCESASESVYVPSSAQLFLTIPRSNLLAAVNFSNAESPFVNWTYAINDASALAYDSLSGNVYVVGAGGLTEVNGSTDQIVATNSTYPAAESILFDSATDRILVAAGNGTLYDVSPTTLRTVWSAHEGPGLLYSVLDPTSQELAVGGAPGQVLLISAADGRVEHSFWIGGLDPYGMSFDPTTGSIVVDQTDAWGNQEPNVPPVSFVRPNNSASMDPVLPTAQISLFDSDINATVLMNEGQFSAVNLTTNTVLFNASVPVSSLVEAAYDPSTGRIFVLNGSTTQVLNARTLAVTGSIPDDGINLAVIPQLHRLYELGWAGTETQVLHVYNTSSLSFVANVTLPGSNCAPDNIAFDAVDDDLFVANPGCSIVTEVDPLNLTANSLDIGMSGGQQIAYDPAAGGVLVTFPYSDQVLYYPVNGTASPSRVFATPSWPNVLTYDPANGEMVVADDDQGTLSLFGPAPVIAHLESTPTVATVNESVTIGFEVSNGYPPYSIAYSGLPPGCESANSTQLTCIPTSEGAFSIVVTVTDSKGGLATGSYLLNVVGALTIASFTASPSTVLAGSNVTLTVQTAGGWGPTTYSYTGLPSGCESSNVSAFTCAPITPGTYVVAATVNDSLGSPSSTNTTVRVLPVLSVTFEETGVPYGVFWQVTFNNTTYGSIHQYLVLREPPGVYQYEFPAESEVNATSPSGIITLTNSAVTVHVTFVQRVVSVVFLERGLPPGTNWTVLFNGSRYSADSSRIAFLFPAGLDSFAIEGPPGWNVSTRNGTSVIIAAVNEFNVTFSPGHFWVKFSESGLSSLTTWGVWIQSGSSGAWLKGDKATLSTELAAGPYNYSASHMVGYSSNGTGEFDVTGNVSLSVAYEPVAPAPFQLGSSSDLWIVGLAAIAIALAVVLWQRGRRHV